MAETVSKELTDEEKAVEARLKGRRCIIRGEHPYAGHSGTCVRCDKTPFGCKPVVDLDIGHEVCVMDPKQWELLPDG